MLHRLLETQAAPPRKPLGTAVSVVLHAALVVGALRATHREAVALTKPVEVMVRHEAPRHEPKPAHTTPPATPLASAPTYRGHQVVIAPLDVPLDIPAIDLSAPGITPADFTGEGPSGGRGTGDPALAPTTSSIGNAPYAEFQVEKAAAALPGSPAPSYPDMLKAAGIEGEALVQFVVDTLGRAEPGSFRVLQSTHDAFGTAVRTTLPRMRFLPAEAGGRKVRMIVQQRFAFALNR